MAWNVFKKKTDEQNRALPEKVIAPLATATIPDVKPAPQAKKPGVFPVSADALFFRPLATEKSLQLARHDVYVFEVAPRATKIEIGKAFANLYGVMPMAVRVAHKSGKVVRFARREGRRRDSKKAYITVPKGTTIDL